MFQIEKNKILYKEQNKIIGFVEFIDIDEMTVDIIRTVVDPSFRGKGFASKLLEYTFHYFENQHKKVICSCSYAAAWETNLR